MGWRVTQFEGAGFSYILSGGDRRVRVLRVSGDNYNLGAEHYVSRMLSDGGKWYFEIDVAELNFLTPGPSQDVERSIGLINEVTLGGVSLGFGPVQGYVDGDVVGVAADFDAAECKFYKNGVLVDTQAMEVTDPSNPWVPVLGLNAIAN